MKTKYRIGSIVPVEGIDPHTGSYLDYGEIVGWRDKYGKPCQRKSAVRAIVESSGKRFGDWSKWAEDHAFIISPFIDDDE